MFVTLHSNRRGSFVAYLLALASSLVLVVSAQVTRGPIARETIAGHQAMAGEVLLKLQSSTHLGQILQDVEADRDEPLGGERTLRRLHSRKHTTAELLSILSTRDDVEYVEPNFIVHAISLPNDPLFPQLWGLFNTGQTVNGNVGRDDRLEGYCRRGDRHRRRLHAPGSRKQHLVRADTIHCEDRREEYHMRRRHPWIPREHHRQPFGAHMRST